jgi:hypothetical protein
MSVAQKGSTPATIWPVSVLIATFLSNPSQGEISRCAAYVRNNGLLGKRPSFNFELDISWAATASERRHLQWELLAREEVRGIFLTARDDVLAVLFAGDRGAFNAWAGTLEPGGAFDPRLHEVGR